MSKFNLLRKKSIAAGAVAVVVVAVGCFGALNMLDVKSTHSSFQKSAKVESEVKAGNLEFTMTKLQVAAADAVTGDSFDGNDSGANISLGDAVGNTTTDNTGDTKVLSYTNNFVNIYPGWEDVYGFEVKNTGSLKAFLNMYLGTAYSSPSDSTVDWDEQDPRKRVKFTVYKSSSLDGTYTKAAEGHLQGSDIATGSVNESTYYGNLQSPGKISGTTAELESSSSNTVYYIVKLEFEDSDSAWAGNDSGDNIYEKAKFNVNFAVGTAGPLSDSFKY